MVLQATRGGIRVLAVLLGLCLLAAAARAAAAEPRVAIRWLGVAGFAIEADGSTLLHDPYLSRPGLLRTLLFSYEPNVEVLTPLVSAGSPAPELARAQLILIGHSHFDHLGDAPWIAQRSGASVAGSPTTAAIAEGYGLAAGRSRALAPGDSLSQGPFDIRVVESRHARVLLGRVPIPGEVTTPPDAPIHSYSFKMGGALAYLIEHRPTGLRLFVLSSAAVHEPALAALREEGVEIDILLPATMGRSPDYARQLVENLRPRLVVPHHFDDFWRSLDHPQAAAPSDPEDVAAFEAEIRAAAAATGLDVDVRLPALWERLQHSGAD